MNSELKVPDIKEDTPVETKLYWLKQFAEDIMAIPDYLPLAHVSALKLGASMALGVPYEMPKETPDLLTLLQSEEIRERVTKAVDLAIDEHDLVYMRRHDIDCAPSIREIAQSALSTIIEAVTAEERKS